MNRDTEMIAALLQVTMDVAVLVQNQMEIDFSECTRKEFNVEARAVYILLLEAGVKCESCDD